VETAVKRRVTLLLLAVVTLALGIGGRLAYLQVVCCDKLRGRASVQHWKEIKVPATRGAILDRQGRELALSLKTQSLFAHPRRVENPEDAARQLAPILGLSRNEVLERLTSKKAFVYLQRFLEPEQVAAVRDLKLPIGETEPFGLLPSSKRYYPRDELAVHVLGFANIDGKGIEGIERQFDFELSGDPTVYLALQDGLNGRVREQTIDSPDKRPWEVILSIDVVLQHLVERELEQVMAETRARAASAVLLDPATGQVLALANRPAADPNRYGEATDDQRVNRAVVHQYEPGSTFKIVSMAAALEHGAVRPGQHFDCENGRYTYRGRSIRDIARNGILSAREVFEKSSNVGMVKIVRRLKPDHLRDTVARFGFGRRTGIELPGELPGTLHPVSKWSGQTQPSLAFGYEVSVTVLQMASALSVIANDGVRLPTGVVLGLRDADGHVHRFPTSEGHRAISRDTARVLKSLMEGVVIRGTGTRAGLSGYRVAGKSGTARKLVGGRYSETETIASFGGFAPLDSPRLVGLVVIDTPRGQHYGGQVAAPVFRRIMEDALGYVRAPRDEGALTLADARSSARRGDERSATR